MSFHRLRVAETVRETARATSLLFDVPESLRENFRWRPGQHVTLRFDLDGEDLRRSYSISSSPFTGDPLRITVQRVEGGRISNYINDRVVAGTEIDVMPAFGSFCLDPVATGHRTHYFFGAGSGITPLYSMLTSVLKAEPRSAVRLLYGNHDAKSILFREPLEALQAAHPEALQVTHHLSSPSMWSWFEARRGRIDEQAVTRFLDENPPYAQNTQYYICGPGGMNTRVRRTLLDLDVPRERIHLESYGGSVEEPDDVRGVDSVATIHFGGAIETVEIPSGTTVLAAIRAAGLEVPYSCQAGVCSACRASLVDGQVRMRARMALEDHEIEAGAILTCQSLPSTDKITLRYEN